MPTVAELRHERNNVYELCKALIERADAEKRAMNAEEREGYDRHFARMEELRVEIDLREKHERVGAELAGSTRQPPATQPGGQQRTADEEAKERRAAAFRSYLEADSLRDLTPAEVRDLQSNQGSKGGFLFAPEQFVDTLIQALDNEVFIRPLATKHTLTDGGTLGAPSLDNDPANPTWSTEIGTPTADTTMSLGKRELKPQFLPKLIKVSKPLLRRTAGGAETLVRDRLAYVYGITQENAFLNGSGAGQPLGLFTASSDGVSTARDVATDNATNAVTMNGLINAKYALKSGYLRSPSCAWLFHRDGVKQIAKLRSDSGAGAGTGDYLWEPSKKVGDPDMLLGIPLLQSEYVPNTFTTGLYVGMIGDFSRYWIADSLAMEIQRLDELYAVTNQVGFLGHLETDGMPVLAEAFSRVKLG